MNNTYVSIDIETTGLDSENCQILEIAAIIDDGTAPIKNCPTFHCYINRKTIIGEPFALSMHATTLRRIATHEKGYRYFHPEAVATHFYDFLRDQNLISKDKKIVVAGKNYANFDARFLRKLTNWNEYVPIHHRILDPAAMYWRPWVDGVNLPDTETCMKRAGIFGDVTHTAVEDAQVVIRLIRNFRYTQEK